MPILAMFREVGHAKKLNAPNAAALASVTQKPARSIGRVLRKAQMMTDEEKLAWGATEDAARKADIAAVKAGTMPLEEAQKAAKRRVRKSGMPRREAFEFMLAAQRAARV